MSLIEAQNVGKVYGDSIVLERVNLKVKEGEFCTLVGASGCGKTTFLKMLLGTEQPSSGKLMLNGKQFPQEPDQDRGIVFQRYSVFPHLTVLQNVMLGEELAGSKFLGRLFGAARTRAKENAKAILESVGLTHALDKYPAELSGGMQQRLAIAQSLIKKPKILLLDEPFGALDPGIRADMHELILDLWKQTQVTIFMITHDLKEGFYLGTRLLVFDKTRHDPEFPNAYGAQITYDIPVGKTDKRIYEEINQATHLDPVDLKIKAEKNAAMGN
ncbi:MAG: lauroyl acyltransferase [Gammaproteobacteria bacterium SG8_11]|nr:MAG: lauroyl acyltransferase [Gammaproteobacteria bacterium SG8_11]